MRHVFTTRVRNYLQVEPWGAISTCQLPFELGVQDLRPALVSRRHVSTAIQRVSAMTRNLFSMTSDMIPIS